MLWRPPRSTRTAPLLPSTTLVRSYQGQMDKAELLREFVFNAGRKGEGWLRDPSGGQVRVQVGLLGFDGPPEFEEFGADASADAAPTAAMTRELEELFDA